MAYKYAPKIKQIDIVPAMNYDKLVRYYDNQRTRRFREYMRSEYGARKYKIARDNTVHVHGVMPNTNTRGWYELGSYLNLALELVG